jgi:hypothetical protein
VETSPKVTIQSCKYFLRCIMTFSSITDFCVYGVMTGVGLSFILWAFGMLPRAFRLFIR